MPHGLSLAEFDAVLFDVDGTLVDSLSALIPGLGDTYERFAGTRPSDEEIKSLIGLPLRKQLLLFGMDDASPEQLRERIEFAIERFEAHKDRESTFEGAVETLRMCKRAGQKTALVTSKSAVELKLFLTRFSGADAVDATVCASDVMNPKPAPESALLACEKLGVEPSRAAFIGDSIYDLRCARDAGACPIAVSYGSTKAETLLNEKPAALFETPEALLHWAEQSLLTTPCPERN